MVSNNLLCKSSFCFLLLFIERFIRRKKDNFVYGSLSISKHFFLDDNDDHDDLTEYTESESEENLGESNQEIGL